MAGNTGDDIFAILWGATVAVFAMFALVFIVPFKILRAIPSLAEGVDAFAGRILPTRSEENETRALWQEVTALRNQSPLATFSSSDIFISVVKDALYDTDLPAMPRARIIEAMLDTTEILLEADGIGEVPTIDWSRPMGMEEGVRLRNHLRTQKRFLGDAEYMYGLWRTAINECLNTYISALPHSAYDDRTDDDEDTASLSAELIDLMPQPAHVIEALIYAFFTEELSNAGLFENIRERLNNKYDTASGVTPTEAKKLTPHELVKTYLADTPLAPLFAPRISFTLPEEARFEHCMVVAGTGHGKTQTLQSLIYDDLQRAQKGECSVVVIDSQGDLINTILHLSEFSGEAEESLADRLMLIDPNDVEYPVCLNMFTMSTERIDRYSAVEREKILNGAIELFEYVFGALLGAELTQKQGVVFRYIARLMLIIPNATIQTLVELMEDGKPFKPYMDQLEGTSKKFFQTQFFDPSFSATKKQILRRLWGVLSNRTFERMFSQPESKIDMFEAMGTGKVILINTAKDLLKQEGSEIFGRFFISMIAQAALERAAIPTDSRMPTFVYIDEAHEYFGGDDRTFEVLLGQARKYRIGITAAMQSLSQASPRLRSSMMANTSIKLAGGVSDSDARSFASEMRTPSEFIRDMYKRATKTEFACFVKNYTPMGIRLSVPLGRMESMPTIDPIDYDILIEQNRKRYAEPLSNAARTETAPFRPENIEPPPSVPVKEEPGHASPASHKQPLETLRRTPPPQQGRGGPAHKDLQEALRDIGHQHGFLAEIEDEVFDSENRARQIDVALRKEGMLIACEISITTKPEHEVENIARCFDAGAYSVFVIAPDPKHRLNIETMANAKLPKEHSSHVSIVLSAEEVAAQLDLIQISPQQEETVMRGYKVHTYFSDIDPDEAKGRREALVRAVMGGDKP